MHVARGELALGEHTFVEGGAVTAEGETGVVVRVERFSVVVLFDLG